MTTIELMLTEVAARRDEHARVRDEAEVKFQEAYALFMRLSLIVDRATEQAPKLPDDPPPVP